MSTKLLAYFAAWSAAVSLASPICIAADTALTTTDETPEERCLRFASQMPAESSTYIDACHQDPMAALNAMDAALGVSTPRATAPQRAEANAPNAAAAANPFLQCLQDLTRQSQFTDLSTKFPIPTLANSSFAMLADESYPTPQQHDALGAWFDGFQKCWQTNSPSMSARWPPEIFQLSSEATSGIEGIGADLYNAKISFGEANRRLQQLNNDITAKTVPIIRQYQAQIAANQAAEQQRAAAAQATANAQEEQEQLRRQQRAAFLLNFMRSMQPRPLPPPQPLSVGPSMNTNCTTVGNITNCTSQ